MLGPLGEAALRFSACKWPIFPLGMLGKRPVEDGGFHNASCDEKRVSEWWFARPGANIGLVTGKASGVDVLDIDVKKADGFASLAELCASHGPLPETSVVETPSGGRHFYFRHHEGVGRRIGLWTGIDVLGDGGYVVAPPSRTPSGVYRTVERRRIAPWPAWILPLIVAKREAPPPGPRARPASMGRHTTYGRVALTRSAEEVSSAKAGGKNAALHFAAFSLGRLVAGGHLAEGDVKDALLSAAMACQYADGEKAAASVIESSLMAGIARGARGPVLSTAY